MANEIILKLTEHEARDRVEQLEQDEDVLLFQRVTRGKLKWDERNAIVTQINALNEKD